MNDEKQLWRKRWLSAICKLTSLELQKASWLDKANTTNPHWSFVEFNCCYFDDLGIDNDYEYQLKQEWITKNELDTIQPWHELLDRYTPPANDHYDVKAILFDKKWLSIIEEGVKVKNKLSKIISKEENEILLEEIDHTQYL
ncbi:hypothetical protein [Persicobacter diffluens]|uniref:Uncharacterized protein n=1 Tax=Persicobacter diffluens TaxID=981 RepID=A0AAN4W2G5_9BACT|nr:hypothetical protein PEDI_44440 [Persicobacter diffluens]